MQIIILFLFTITKTLSFVVQILNNKAKIAMLVITEFDLNMKVETSFEAIAPHQSTVFCWHHIALMTPYFIKYG